MRFYTLAVLSSLLIAGLAAGTIQIAPLAAQGSDVSIATFQPTTLAEQPILISEIPAPALPYRGSGRRTVGLEC